MSVASERRLSAMFLQAPRRHEFEGAGPVYLSMKKILILWTILLIFSSACEKKSSAPEGKPEAQAPPKVAAAKEEDKMGEAFPAEIKIKLKWDGKTNYSWELTGSDVDQILKADEKLRKQLGDTKSK